MNHLLVDLDIIFAILAFLTFLVAPFNTIIYENTIIGDNNIILENNILGCLPVEANIEYNKMKCNGLIIGNNNFFHISNKISSGFYHKTIIKNNNKFLSDVYISHDNIIHNNITFYPRVFSAGLVKYFNYSNIGACACIHQHCKIGSYSMIGMNSTITKNVMPFFICINNKYTRLNKHVIPKNLNIDKYNTKLLKIISYIKDTLIDENILKEIKDLPNEICEPILEIYN